MSSVAPNSSRPNNLKKIMLVGGGSGGHLTPLVAVASALKTIDKDIYICQVGQKGEDLRDVTEHQDIDGYFEITAGKFRRYNGESIVKQLLDVKTILLNSRDFFRFLGGTIQSVRLLRRIRPDAIFLKGGFVSVPIGLAAKICKIPYITHDSDAIPGLANRLTAKNAIYNTTAMDTSLYPYDSGRVRQVGIPLLREYRKVTKDIKAKSREQLCLRSDNKVLVSVGGGLGAQKINRALVRASIELLKDDKLVIYHITGKKLYKETEKMYESVHDGAVPDRVHLIDFSAELFTLTEACDIAITRAGATNIAEFAMQAKPIIVVPNPALTGGQQLENAKVLEKSNSALILIEDELDSLSVLVKSLFSNQPEMHRLSEAIHKLAAPNAALKIAKLLTSL